MQQHIIAPSILSADFARLGDDVSAVLKAGGDWVHIDVMDNHYVPNLTFGPLVCSALRAYGVQAFFDVHLMVEPVDDLIQKFAEAGANLISFHPEATKHVERSIQLIKSLGCQAGLALNPASTLDWLDYVVSDIDLVLLMSVNPGFGGQKFIPSALAKIKACRKRLDAAGSKARIEVDGGIGVHNIAEIAAAGADTFVAGSAIFGQKDYAQVIRDMRAKLTGK